jgi:hypothetical protein
MAKNDGGFVFPGAWHDHQPHTGTQVIREEWHGMTRRQLYAGLAMAGDAASGAITREDSDDYMANNARLYWRMADALLVTESEE